MQLESPYIQLIPIEKLVAMLRVEINHKRRATDKLSTEQAMSVWNDQEITVFKVIKPRLGAKKRRASEGEDQEESERGECNQFAMDRHAYLMCPLYVGRTISIQKLVKDHVRLHRSSLAAHIARIWQQFFVTQHGPDHNSPDNILRLRDQFEHEGAQLKTFLPHVLESPYDPVTGFRTLQVCGH